MSAPQTQLPPFEDRGPKLITVWWTEIAIASVFIALRFWARRYKRVIGWDDAFMVAAWLCFMGDGVVLQLSSQNGGNLHFAYLTPKQMEFQLKLVVVALDIGILTTTLGKIAIGITILRIVGDTSKWQKWSVWFIVLVTGTTAILDFFLLTFRCGDPRNLWELQRIATAKCLDVKAILKFNDFCNGWQIFADFFFSLLPMAIVWNLRMPLGKKLQLGIGLGLTLVTGAAAVVKTVLTSRVDTTDPTWSLFTTLVWFGTEAMLIIVLGSIPVLYPLWERFISKPFQQYSASHYSNITGKGSASKTPLKPGTTSDIELAGLTQNATRKQTSVAYATSKGDPEMGMYDGCYNGRIHVVNEVDVTSGDRGRSSYE